MVTFILLNDSTYDEVLSKGGLSEKLNDAIPGLLEKEFLEKSSDGRYSLTFEGLLYIQQKNNLTEKNLRGIEMRVLKDRFNR